MSSFRTSTVVFCLSVVALATVVSMVGCSADSSPSSPGVLDPQLRGTEATVDGSDGDAGAVSAETGAKRGPAPRVDICHRRGPNGYMLITVNQNAVPGHRRHGDGLPGEEVPGQPGFVFDDSCRVVEACVYGEPTAVPNEFEEDGGTGQVTYAINSTACECAGESDVDWIAVTGTFVAADACQLDFTVAAWDVDVNDTEIESRGGTILTPAGGVSVSQIEGETTAGETDICTIDPSNPECDEDGSVSDPF